MGSFVIPMLVEAFVAGKAATDRWRVPVAAPDYKTALSRSVLGSVSTPGVDMTEDPLKPGIHLHFILPDAFTYSPDAEHYPAVPNRYLVTRIWQEEGADMLKARSFLVESDFLSQDKKAYGDSITIPVFGGCCENPQWRYLGRSFPLDMTAKHRECGGTTDGGTEYLDMLTAIGPGDMMFAAYYPSCRSVFGFHDDLADLPAGGVVRIHYMVMGYYSDKGKDPFCQPSDEKELEELMLSRGLSVNGKPQPGKGCVLYGTVGMIEWKGFSYDYCPVPSGRVDVTLGNTSAEALSRVVCNGVKNVDGLTERMLTALQYDLYDEATQPDGNFIIDDAILCQTFSKLAPQEGENADCPDDGENQRLLQWTQRQLGAVWELYVMLYEDGEELPPEYPSRQTLLNRIEELCTEIEKLKVSCSKSQPERPGMDKSVQASDFSFYAPKNPVILLSGPGMNRSHAFGEDGRFTKDGTLLCQAHAVTSDLDSRQVLEKCLKGSREWNWAALPQEYESLLYQTILVNDELREYASSKLGEIKVQGEQPSRVAVNREPFVWNTLLMLWKADYRSLEEGDATLTGWDYEYGETNLTYHGGKEPENLKEHVFSGRILLTPHAVKGFGDMVRRHGELYGEDEELDRLAGQIENLPVYSQNLSGFGEAFSGYRQALQLPVINIGEPEELTERIAADIGVDRLSIMTDKVLMPLRGGYIKITKLTLVGTFGQTQPLIDASYYNDGEVSFSETLDCGKKDFGLLAPAFTSPVRLWSEFVSASDDGVVSGESPDTSPVCGILVPELLNHRLLSYTASGQYIGMVKTVVRNGKKEARWLSAPGLSADFDELEIQNQYFRDFLKNLLVKEGAFSSLQELTEQYLDRKLRRHGLFWGRPLVLARLCVQLESFGKPEVSKQIADFGREETRGIQKLCIPLQFGDMERVSDGVLGAFDGEDFTKMYPAFGAGEVKNRSDYLAYGEHMELAQDDGRRSYTVVMEPDAPIHLQTGLLPVREQRIPAVHTKMAGNLSVAAELSPVLASTDRAGLPPMPYEDGEKEYLWSFLSGDTYQQCKIGPPVSTFEDTVLMDGMMEKEE